MKSINSGKQISEKLLINELCLITITKETKLRKIVYRISLI